MGAAQRSCAALRPEHVARHLGRPARGVGDTHHSFDPPPLLACGAHAARHMILWPLRSTQIAASPLATCAGIVIGGVPITLLDTAGLRESGDLVEQIGVERSLAAARQADIVLMVVDGQSGWTDGDADIFQTVFGAGAARGERGLASDWGSGDEGSDGANSSNGSTAGGGGGRGGPPALLVLNKSDLAAQQAQQRDGAQGGGDGAAAAAAGVPAPAVAQFAAVVQTSAATKQGLEELRSAVLQLAGAPQVRWRGGLLLRHADPRRAGRLDRHLPAPPQLYTPGSLFLPCTACQPRRYAPDPAFLFVPFLAIRSWPRAASAGR